MLDEGVSLDTLEKKKIDELRRISADLGSVDLGRVYTAAGRMMSCSNGRSLLAKVISLLSTRDSTLSRLALRALAKNVYGDYIPVLFGAIQSISPAEAEQVLQMIEELFHKIGGPRHPSEQTSWIDGLSRLGKEHQPTVFGIMAALPPKGPRWVLSMVQRDVTAILPSSIQKLRVFPEALRTQILKVLIRESSIRKRDLLPHILGVLDSKTIQLIIPYLRQATWEERVEIAKSVGRVGVTTTGGIVTELVSDSDWRVKQALTDNIDISKSRFTALLRILEFLAADSHMRVRASAERLMLLLGVHACTDSNIDVQRARLMHKFRKQLLEAAPTQRTIDTSWLGIEIPDRVIVPVFTEEEARSESHSVSGHGITISEISSVKSNAGVRRQGILPDLRAALLKRRNEVATDLNGHGQSQASGRAESVLVADDTETTEEPSDIVKGAETGRENEDDTLAREDNIRAHADKKKIVAPEGIGADSSPVEIVLSLMRQITSTSGSKDVEERELRRSASEVGLDEHTFELVIRQLERDGLMYKSGHNRLRLVDMSL